MYHTGHFTIHMPFRFWYQIAYAVNHPHPKICILSQRNFHGFIGHKFWLCGHDGSAGSRLGQFILRPFPNIIVFDVRQHQQIHKSFDECGFSCTHRPNYTNINVTICSFRNVAVNIISSHFLPSCKIVSIQYNLWSGNAE